MATTAIPTATPRTKACWVEHLTDRVLLQDIDESQWVFAGEWYGAHPVYQGQANAGHRLYRSGSTWFYTKSGKFTKLAQAEHRDGTDPNIPPLGYGWIFCKDRSAVVGIQFSVVDSVDAMLKQIEVLGESLTLLELQEEIPPLMASDCGLTILDAVRERLTPLFYNSSKQMFSLTPTASAMAAMHVKEYFVNVMTHAKLDADGRAIVTDANEGKKESSMRYSTLSMLKNKWGTLSDDESVSSVLSELTVVNDLLAQVCDVPLDATKWDGLWHANRGAVVQRWLSHTIVAGASAAVSELLGAEVEMVRDSVPVQNRFKVQAHNLQKEDRQIYTAAMKKEIKKDLKGWGALTHGVEVDGAQIKAAFPDRPTQPGLDAAGATVLDLKHQAALEYIPFRSFMRTLGKLAVTTGDGKDTEWTDLGIVDDLKSLDVTVAMAKSLKRAERIVQKIFLRGTVASICDVVRALISVPDIETMHRVHSYLFQSDAVQIVDFKDRLNTPTSGGWSDLVYLVTLKNGTGHICEIQLALQPMLTAREGMHGHKAYGEARHLVEVLHYLKIDCTPDEPTEISVLEQNEKLEVAVMQREAEIFELKRTITMVSDGKPAGVEARGRYGWTPLIMAAMHGDAAMVAGLLAGAASVHALSTDGNTALICAAINGHTDVAALLLDGGAWADAQNHLGFSALIYAASEGWVATAEMLVERNADITRKTKDGKIAFDLAHPTVRAETVLMARLQVHVPVEAPAEESEVDGAAVAL